MTTMKNKTLLKKAKVILCFIMLGFLPFSLMAQCPATVVDNSTGAGANFDFDAPACPSGYPASITINGGAATIFAAACNPGGPTQNYQGAPGAPGLPATFNFGAPIGDCEYDASGALIVDEVPTLSEWGLLILALLFMTMGTLYIINNKELALKE